MRTKMFEAVFSPTVTVVSCVCEYLKPKEVCKTRQVSKFCTEHLYNFQEFAESNGAIKCGGCPAMRMPRFLEHCPLCEKEVCVDHLERCNECLEIICCECRGVCCR